MRAHVLRGLNLTITLHHRNHVAANRLGNLHKHQSDGTASNDGNRVANLDTCLVKTTKHAGQGLNHRRFLVADVRRDRQHVDLDDAPRNSNVFRISPVVEQQVFAKIGLMLEQ